MPRGAKQLACKNQSLLFLGWAHLPRKLQTQQVPLGSLHVKPRNVDIESERIPVPNIDLLVRESLQACWSLVSTLRCTVWQGTGTGIHFSKAYTGLDISGLNGGDARPLSIPSQNIVLPSVSPRSSSSCRHHHHHRHNPQHQSPDAVYQHPHVRFCCRSAVTFSETSAQKL